MAVTYSHVDDATRAALLQDRLRAVENEHWRLTVDEAAGVVVGPGPAGFPAAGGDTDQRTARIAELEEAHKTLSDMLAEVEGTKSPSRRSSAKG